MKYDNKEIEKLLKDIIDKHNSLVINVGTLNHVILKFAEQLDGIHYLVNAINLLLKGVLEEADLISKEEYDSLIAGAKKDILKIRKKDLTKYEKEIENIMTNQAELSEMIKSININKIPKA